MEWVNAHGLIQSLTWAGVWIPSYTVEFLCHHSISAWMYVMHCHLPCGYKDQFQVKPRQKQELT